MAKMTAAQRKRLKKKAFALKGKRKYPIHDKAHAKAALSMAARKDTEGDEKTVRAAVTKKYPSLKKDAEPERKSRLQKFEKKRRD
jgi:hypothetical protein